MEGLSWTAQPMKRRSLHADLAESLRDMIVTGQLAPDTKVPEKELCALYGVSRTPLREALKVLAADGFVLLEPNRGARVSPITSADLDEVFPVLGALEALAGELACRHVTDQEIAQIADLQTRMVACHQNQDLAGYFAINQEIHEAILQAARNETLSSHYRSLSARLRRARYVANMTETRWAQATAEHEEILRHLSARDGEALAATLKLHLENKCITVRDWLTAKEAESRAAS